MPDDPPPQRYGDRRTVCVTYLRWWWQWDRSFFVGHRSRIVVGGTAALLGEMVLSSVVVWWNVGPALCGGCSFTLRVQLSQCSVLPNPLTVC